MSLILIKILKWLVGKFLGIFLLVAAVIGIYALYLYLDDNIRLERERLAKLEEYREQAKAVYAELDDVHTQLIEVGERIQDSREKLKLATETLEALEGFLAKIEYFFSTEEERKAYDRKLNTARNEKNQLNTLLFEITETQSQLRVSRASLTEQSKNLEKNIDQLESASSELIRYLDASWKRWKPYLPLALAVLILGPVACKAFCYYVLAPLVVAAKPIRMSQEPVPPPSIGSSGVSVSLKMQEGQKAWVKESYLQASDESMSRKTRFILNWQIPITCIAAGLIEMVEFTAKEGASGSNITVSTQDKPDMELSLIELTEDASMVVRPSHLVGVASITGDPVQIERRWNFFRLQAWITLQFRFFVFKGPCQLLVSGIRGVREEKLDGPSELGRRANQDSTIGFTPDLNYGTARAETFWTYFRGFNPLFDDVFRGRGSFLCQEISKGSELGSVRRFWAGFRDSLLKLVGI